MFTVRRVDGMIDITEAGNIPTQKALNQPKEGLRHKTGFFNSLLGRMYDAQFQVLFALRHIGDMLQCET